MSESAAFASVCEELERATDLDRLEARGTVRLALKQSGLDARTVGTHEMGVVVEKILPTELESRGIADASSVCQSISGALASVSDEGTADSPDAVFARLGG